MIDSILLSRMYSWYIMLKIYFITLYMGNLVAGEDKNLYLDIVYDERVKIPPKKRYDIEINIINTKKGILKVIEEEEITEME